MLFIQTINFCLEKIQCHFEQKLSLPAGTDYEIALIQKFALQFVDEGSKRVPKTILKGLTYQQERETKSSNSPVEDSDVLELKPPSDEVEPLEDNWMDILDRGENILKEQMFYQQSTSHNQMSMDETNLRLGTTWGRLVSSTYDEFVHFSRNHLINEQLTDLKMLILARYARQLQIIMNVWGIKILEHREARLLMLQNNREDTEALKQSFQKKSVDDWLLSVADAAANEANELLTQSLKARSVNLGWGLSYSSTPGTTEDVVFACKHTMKSMHEYICKHDKDAYCQFGDMFPTQLKSENALNISLRDLSAYLIQNFFDEGMHLAREHRGVILNKDKYTFDTKKAEMKREQAQDLLKKIDTLEANKPLNYWDDALNAVDTTAFTHANHAVTAPSFFQYYLSRARLPSVFQKVHDGLISCAPQDVKRKHHDCKLT